MAVHSALGPTTIPRLGSVSYDTPGKSPAHIIAADRKRLDVKGVTLTQISTALQRALTGTNRRSRRLFSAETLAWKRRDEWDRRPQDDICPIEGCGHKEAPRTFRLTSHRSDLVITGAWMLIHLIERHGFFGSKESDSRVDPDRLMEALLLPRGATPNPAPDLDGDGLNPFKHTVRRPRKAIPELP